MKGQLKPLRVRVEIGTKDAYLWAPFGDHMKAGLVSLLPILIVAFVAAAGYLPGDTSFSDRVFGSVGAVGDTIVTFGWVLILVGALYCAAWAAMSVILVHLFRYRPSFYTHLASHAIAGGLILGLLTVGIVALRRSDELAGAAIWELEGFAPDILAAIAIGMVGAAVGAWALRRLLFWYVTKEREPLKDVFEFVEGKRLKGEFERL